jgi:hypothetical protein
LSKRLQPKQEHLIKELFQDISISRVFNVDGTSISAVPNKPSKIFEREEESWNSFFSRKRNNSIAVACCNAAGSYVAPLLIFPGAKENTDLLSGVP